MNVHRTQALTVLLGLAAPAVLLASPAAAQRVEGGPYHEEYTDVYTDFCDVNGLTVDYAAAVDGHYTAIRRASVSTRSSTTTSGSARPTPTRRPG